MNKSKYRVWECKIVVPYDTILPNGFDNPPRCAAVQAVEDVTGVPVLSCFSGWGGELTEDEAACMNEGASNVYYAGTLDIPDPTEH